MIAQFSRSVEAARVNEIIGHYLRFERDAEARAERERFEARVREIVFQMTAHDAARRATDGA